jgi:two-component system LytT family response regulator
VIKAIVADDEAVARRRIARLLREEGVSILAECAGGAEVVDQIASSDADLVFLDVQMPDLTGIEVVERVGPEKMPPVVFITAHDQYAIREFELNAVDYLLKPYDTPRFKQALERAKARLTSSDEDRRTAELRSLVTLLLSEKPERPLDSVPQAPVASVEGDRIAVPVNGVLRVVRTGEIDWVETDGNYLRLHAGKANYLFRSTATEFERQLDPVHFARIHRRYIVNLDRVVEIQPWFAGDAVVILKDGTKLRMSRGHREAFHKRFLKQS